jgi:hypothetical protein
MSLPVPNPTESYWLKNAHSKLADHQSSATLPDKVDILIIGSGLSGSSMAYYLLKNSAFLQGTTVAMIEARAFCSGAVRPAGTEAVLAHAGRRAVEMVDTSGPIRFKRTNSSRPASERTPH